MGSARTWRYALGVAAAAALVLCSGCGEGTQVTLKVANWVGPEEIAIEEANLDGFRRQHPGIRVILEPVPRPGEYKQKITASIAGGTAPDVFLLDAIHVAEFVQARVLLDLHPYAVRCGLDLGAYYPHVLALARRDSALFALPKDFTPLVVFYNRVLFDRAGLAYPGAEWTWDEYLKLATALTVDLDGDGRTDQFGGAMPPEYYVWPPWVWSNGGDFLDPTGTRASGYLDGEATVEALEFLLALSTVHGVAPPHARLEAMGGDLGMFLAGRLAMAVSGHWWMPQIDAVPGDELRVGIAPIPIPAGQKGEHVTALYAAGWAVWSDTPQPELAVELALHLSAEAASRRRVAQRLAIPAHRALATQIMAQDSTGLEAAFLAEVPFARAPWGTRLPRAGTLRKQVEEAYAAALLQGRDLRQTLQVAAQRLDAELGRGSR